MRLALIALILLLLDAGRELAQESVAALHERTQELRAEPKPAGAETKSPIGLVHIGLTVFLIGGLLAALRLFKRG